MTDATSRPPVGRSVFVKLVAIMLAMAVVLLSLVTLFFVMIVSPNVSGPTEHLIEEFARVEASQSLDLPRAQRLASQLDLAIRYEGPRGTWSTSPNLPAIAQVENTSVGHPFAERGYYVVSSPDGGQYLFEWTISRRLQALHRRLLTLLLFLMAGVVFGAYAFQKQLLRPLRSLATGVAQLSEGHLDVAVPVASRDEFGELTDAFNQMARRVRAMMQARDQLLLDVSHELRSPLTRMKVAIELLPDRENKSGMAADLNEMEGMVSELLELERLRDGRRLTKSRQDLIAIVRDVAGQFQTRAPGVRLALPTEQIVIELDGEKIRTVIRNLLDNAINYSMPNSRAVEVSVTQSSGAAQIVVRDDGAGIPADEFARVFEPFYRIDRSRSRKTGGYGLGLSICKRIVEAHGGSISMQTNFPRGVSFVVSIPSSAADESSPMNPLNHAPQREPGLKRVP